MNPPEDALIHAQAHGGPPVYDYLLLGVTRPPSHNQPSILQYARERRDIDQYLQPVRFLVGFL